MLARALEAHRGGRLEEAERRYLEVHASGPPRREVVHLLGLVSHGLGKKQKAIEWLRQATELEPSVADGHNDLGNVLHECGQWDEAERAYRRAIEADAAHVKAHSNLGVVLKDKGLLDEAVACYRRAIELDGAFSDAHYNLGVALKQKGELDDAVEALQRALALSPGMSDARRLLCGVLREAGRLEELEAAFDDWLQREPTNPVVGHLRAALEGSDVPTRASDEYVRSVFDGFAAHFDEDLAALGYEGPRLIGEALAKAVGSTETGLVILDAGCGTGLCAAALRPFAGRLEGVDLSAEMVKRAAQREVYDQLEVGELTAFMNNRENRYDVIVVADTLMYFGDLRPPLRGARGALKARGHLIFSLELGVDGSTQEGFALQPNGRYKHGLEYVKRSVEDAALRIASCERVVMRREAGEDVAALLVHARKG